MVQFVTEWSTDDPRLAESLKLIAAQPEYSSLRMELEAALHMAQARICWMEAERLGRREKEQAAREARRAKR